MKSFISLIFFTVVLNKACGLPIQNIANGNPYLLNNLAMNNLMPVGFPSAANANIFANANYLPNNYANPILEPIATTNAFANSIIPNEAICNIPNTIASANLIPNNIANIEFTNVQFTPVLSELMPSLQFGDVTVAGDLPIGGTIKVCGCIPVYGMITLDGIVPSAGTAVVVDSIGSQIPDGIPKCQSIF
ncbi:uncharacterized protein LOC123879089 [Maniola jurtina]|uniref:uncharacterized protein LOC123879089 n=1 Tax=Maniola jurtina TaxID=191418 RepID=UPI001E68CC81|nr:uncharacterized protein LOC123879089 [Maniola jurtina]